ncbi:MAG: 30S ribosome-binding factor RbfA [Akkermansia sp.]|nr:30S ribosome-binding factor RbfA [Akkermansia sp.]MBQ7024687.1 30S ribosome-binding factor RbfA [Akkermansia sp.]
MATRRLDKVNELMKREIGSFVQKEFEWNGTIVSILQVEITEDLKEGRVWVGVVGRMSPAQVIDKLTRNRGLIQKAVSKRVVLRNTPRLTFKHDNSAQRGVDLVNLLEDIDKNLPKAPPLPEGETDPEI